MALLMLQLQVHHQPGIGRGAGVDDVGRGFHAGRLLIGLAVTLVFTVLPYFGPWLAIANYVRKDTCDPNSGSACKIFGGEVSDIYSAVRVTAPELLYGGLLAIGIFIIYAVAVSVKGAVSARRPIRAEQQNS